MRKQKINIDPDLNHVLEFFTQILNASPYSFLNITKSDL